eukprot:3067670-Rhodomonas_salina.2
MIRRAGPSAGPIMIVMIMIEATGTVPGLPSSCFRSGWSLTGSGRGDAVRCQRGCWHVTGTFVLPVSHGHGRGHGHRQIEHFDLVVK